MNLKHIVIALVVGNLIAGLFGFYLMKYVPSLPDASCHGWIVVACVTVS